MASGNDARDERRQFRADCITRINWDEIREAATPASGVFADHKGT
jgi:hypothetical protein